MESDFREEIKSLIHNDKFGVGHHRIVCPCAEFRKAANRRERTLSLDVEYGKTIFSCHHCGSSGAVKSEAAIQTQTERKVTKLRLKKAPDDEAKEWLLARKISEEAIARAGVRFVEWRGQPAVAYAYYEDGAVKAAKVRSVHEKKFAWDGNTENAYLWHLVDFSKDYLHLTEGEVDALSLLSAGLDNVISVPHGAPNSNNDKGEYRFAFLANNIKKFEGFKRIVLCGDQDPRGQDLMVELSRRLGRHRCYELKLPEGQKDCNETLTHSGAETLRRAIANAKALEIPGLAPASMFRDNVRRLYNGEIGSLVSTGLPSLDKIYQICPGTFTTVTGHSGHGKSLLWDWINISLAKRLNWNIGYWSAEVPGHVHISKLAEIYTNKRFHSNMKNRMDEEELETALAFIEAHFSFMTQDESATTSCLIERATAMVMRYGIKSLVLDPFNYMSLPGAKREDMEISDMLSAWLNWAKTYEVWTTLIAHPRNIEGHQIPDGTHISGGNIFRNKTDFGLTVYRDGLVNTVRCWKSKHDHIAKEGEVDLEFDQKRCEFYNLDDDAERPERKPRYSAVVKNDYEDEDD